MKSGTKIRIAAVTMVIWAVVFLMHGYYHVRNLTGQCCGYEGDPGFLALFFLIKPGLYYFLALIFILCVEIAIFWRHKK